MLGHDSCYPPPRHSLPSGPSERESCLKNINLLPGSPRLALGGKLSQNKVSVLVGSLSPIQCSKYDEKVNIANQERNL